MTYTRRRGQITAAGGRQAGRCHLCFYQRATAKMKGQLWTVCDRSPRHRQPTLDVVTTIETGREDDD